jgi:hypothetical protein
MPEATTPAVPNPNITYPYFANDPTKNGAANLYNTSSPTALLQGYNTPIFAKATMKEFYDESIVPRMCNVQYEAELKKWGDKIYIRKEADIHVNLNTHKVGGDVNYEDLTADEPIEMVIDHSFDWGFLEHDVINQQTDLKDYVTKVLGKVAQRVRDAVEPEALTSIINQIIAAGTQNQGTAAGVVSKAYDLGTMAQPIDLSMSDDAHTIDKLSVRAANLVADLYGVLKEQNVLTDGQVPYIVAPYKFLNVLTKSALQTGSYAEGGTTQGRGMKAVGMVQGCEIYTSNYVGAYASGTDTNVAPAPAGTAFPIICGIKDAVTWAQTITKMEQLRHPTKFADIHRGMGIYGYKVIEPKAIALAWVKFKA